MTTSPSPATPARTGRMRRGTGSGPQPYDFRRPIKLSREHVRMLQIAFETYGRNAGTLLTTRLRVNCTANLLSVDQLTYEEYIGQLGNPTVVAAVTVEPLTGTMLFELPMQVAMAAIDHMLGGPGGVQPERELTDVETPLLQDLLKRMLGELRYGFERLVDIQPKLGTIEYNPQFVRTQSPGDAVVVATFEVKVGEVESSATLCLPFTTILPVLETDADAVELTAAEQAELNRAHANLAAGLVSAPIDVAVRFRGMTMRTDEIVKLAPGDVVPLGHPVALPLEITVNDTTFAHAVPGNQGARLACLIVPPPKESHG
ncbi:flagellar motor switch protein FliM [Pilimelia anulata]|uniref:Flagellar motor switch protein FliM n=1 Tax=Pilimelia anulata TaxID=53371 RepID=A0A8J3B0D8_9ACTN|nr:flagellar motor switch protein FliM [Pilimelia anulata]GGJ82361.1 flagellar motor switch protein FliM [Pilimelia anulata]